MSTANFSSYLLYNYYGIWIICESGERVSWSIHGPLWQERKHNALEVLKNKNKNWVNNENSKLQSSIQLQGFWIHTQIYPGKLSHLSTNCWIIMWTMWFRANFEEVLAWGWSWFKGLTEISRHLISLILASLMQQKLVQSWIQWLPYWALWSCWHGIGMSTNMTDLLTLHSDIPQRPPIWNNLQYFASTQFFEHSLVSLTPGSETS